MTTFYGTVVGYKAWADARGTSYSGKADNEITQALTRASCYIDGAYQGAFSGWKAEGRSQTLQWPRAAAVDAEGLGVDGTEVPVEIENATYEGAVRELASPGSLDPDLKAGGGVIQRVKAGSTEVEFAVNAVTTKTYQRIDQALAPLIGATSAYSGRTARA